MRMNGEKEVRKAEKVLEMWREGEIHREDIEDYLRRTARALDTYRRALFYSRLVEGVITLFLALMTLITATQAPVLTYVAGETIPLEVPWWYNPITVFAGIGLNPVSLSLFMITLLLAIHLAHRKIYGED